MYTQHPGSAGHAFGRGCRWLSAVGSRVASGRALVGAHGSEDAAAGCTLETQEIFSGKHVTASQ